MQGSDQVSAFSSVTEREAGYAHIQKEILASIEVTRNWKQRHNELSLIFRLPSEILASVFKNVQQFRVSTFQWLSVTHVCHHWRQVALEHPSIWNCISLESPKLAQEMLHRSKSSPLTIDAVYPWLRIRSEAGFQVLKNVLKELQRIKHLQLQLHDETRSRAVLEFLGHPAPLLETCNIGLNTNSRLLSLFSSVCPSLKTLSISGCTLDWKSSSFHVLKTLEVCCDADAQKQPFYDILSALSRMPFLESLTYDGLCEESAPALSVPTVNLPQLRSLEIRSNLAACVVMSGFITYPQKCRIMFTCSPNSNQSQFTEADSLPLRTLATRIGNKLPASIASINIGCRTIEAKMSEDSISPVDLKISLTGAIIDEEIVSQIFKSMLEPLPMQDIKSLLVSDIKLSSSFWTTVFGDLKYLRKIDIDDTSNYGSGFLRALSPECASSPNNPTPTKFLALDELVLTGWVFDVDEPDYDTTQAVSEGIHNVVQNLTECLRRRKKQGLILGDLILDECRHVNDEDVEALQEIAIRVEWDGEFRYSDDEDEDEDEDDTMYHEDYYDEDYDGMSDDYDTAGSF